jgi:hypothetical protein
VAQVEAVGLNDEEMALVIRRFNTALRGRKEYNNKNKSRGSTYASSVVRLVRLSECHASSSTLEYVSICNKCKDIGVDVCIANVDIIADLNDKMAILNAQVKNS